MTWVKVQSLLKYLHSNSPPFLSHCTRSGSKQCLHTFCTLHSEHSKATMEGYERFRFVLLCTFHILKLASYNNIVVASTISPSGKVDLVIFFTQIAKEWDVYSCSYQIISTWFSCLCSLKSHLLLPTRLLKKNRLLTV